MKIDKAKIEWHAKKSHGTCKGTGIAGWRTVVGTKKGTSNMVIICPCVYRELKRLGVNVDSADQMAKAIGVEEKKEEERVA